MMAALLPTGVMVLVKSLAESFGRSSEAFGVLEAGLKPKPCFFGPI